MIYLFIFYLGSMFGSYINVVCIRGIIESSKGRSICPCCKKQLKWFHNIPIISFILLKGKCAFCNNKIGYRYFLFEIAFGIFFLGSFLIYVKVI
jgi:leader peptidase (prepilin peptidase) / N-methyltransferase